jgi:hypothetical protein
MIRRWCDQPIRQESPDTAPAAHRHHSRLRERQELIHTPWARPRRRFIVTPRKKR